MNHGYRTWKSPLSAGTLSRGVTELTDAPEQQNDLRLAARVIRSLVRSFAPSDIVTINGA